MGEVACRWLRRSLCAALLSACASPPPGAPCPEGANCGGGLQCETSQDFPLGACTIACDPARPACPASSQCTPLASGSWCLATCEASKDCLADRRCVSLNGKQRVCAQEALPAAAASPACAPLQIVLGGTAGPPAEPAGCQRPLVSSALPPEHLTHLGVHSTGDTLSFEVPDGSVGLTIVSQAVSAQETLTSKGAPEENSVVPTLVRAPGGRLLFDDSLPPPVDYTAADAVYVFPTGATGAFTLPSTSKLLSETQRSGLPAGTWTFTVNDFAAECPLDPDCSGGGESTYDVSVWTRPGPIPEEGTLDVAIYWATGGSVTAGNASADPHTQRMLEAFQRLLAPAGICLGTVTFYDVPAWAVAKYATSTSADEVLPCQNLNQLFTLAQPGNRLNLFFVDDIQAASAGAGEHVGGRDGTIPGPSGFSGTVKGGAAVSIADLAEGSCGAAFLPSVCGADTVAYVAAHEAGHWLGLYHVSESTGEQFDLLADTPVCKCETCAGPTVLEDCSAEPGGSVVLGGSCLQGTQACGGSDNLMFWVVDLNSVGAISPEQARVMRLNPLVH